MAAVFDSPSYISRPVSLEFDEGQSVEEGTAFKSISIICPEGHHDNRTDPVDSGAPSCIWSMGAFPRLLMVSSM